MIFTSELIPGVLIRRYKRFLADVTLMDGSIVTAHCPNTGSMLSCNAQGSEVLLSYHNNPKRKYSYTWEMVRANNVWIGINTQVPNRLVYEAIVNKEIPELMGYEDILKEQKVGEHSRLDLMLRNKEESCYVEIKNVTLVENKIAFFPDAVTSRGTKHLNELISLRSKGHRAVIFFLIQRSDGNSFAPASDIDPVYAETLKIAKNKGVEILAYRTIVSPNEIKIDKRIEVLIDV